MMFRVVVRADEAIVIPPCYLMTVFGAAALGGTTDSCASIRWGSCNDSAAVLGKVAGFVSRYIDEFDKDPDPEYYENMRGWAMVKPR